MEYDVVIIGGGPGGYVAAIRAAQLRGRVALVEERELGGVCLNRGCIPTKALVASAHALRTAERSQEFGFRTGEVRADFAEMGRRKEQVVARLRKGIESLLKRNGVELVRGHGILLDPRTVEVRDGTTSRTLRTRNIIVATGSEPLRPAGFPFDGKRVITSDEAIELKELPPSVVIVGGGYIGVEWAGIFSALGVKVTIVEMMEQLLPRSDADIAAELLREFKKAGVKVFLGARVETVDTAPTGVTCRLSGGETLSADTMLVCIGRATRTGDIGLESAGVRVERGAVAIDDHCRTSVPGIYAIGDVTARLMLAHVASRQGIVAAECAMGHETRVDLRAVPACVFTDPEIAAVGRTAAECEKDGIEVRESRFSFASLGMAHAIGDTRGWVKIVAEAKSGVVLGVHIIGPHASILIAEAALAMTMEATVEEIAAAIHAHPSLPEALMEDAEKWLGRAIHG